MRIDNNHKMTMVRGDTELFTVSYPEQPFETGDVVHFSVAKSFLDAPCLHIEVSEFEQGIAEIHIPHSATAGLDVGHYVYDVRVIRENGDYQTIIGGLKEDPAVFALAPEVTK
jgi:hypothetical protein